MNLTPVSSRPSGLPASSPRSSRAAALRVGGLLTGLAASLWLSACAAPPLPPGKLPPGVADTAPVVLGEGDVLKLYFPGAAEYNGIQKIRPDGKISLPVVGEVQAAGKTLNRLQSDLAGRYQPHLTNSEVVVSLEASGKPVILSGAVGLPGKLVLERPTTLLEAIMGSGGFKDFAVKKKVRLIRLVNGAYHTSIYDLRDGLNGGSVPLIYLKPGDIVYVPQSNW